MFRLRSKLKASSGTSQIFVNGDLTARRAALARNARVKTRDITSDVWIGTRVDWPSPGINSTVKVFYNSEIPEFTHVYDYRAGPPDFSVFDVSSCYNEPSQVMKLTFSVRACYDVLLRHDPRLFEAALRKFIVGNVYSSSSVSLEDAVRRLGLVVDQQTDFGITVNYPEGTVALVSCGMMFVGLFMTPAAAYVIWKKNIAFPYLSN
ncbi:hypothetical protein NP493_1850g00007 [Ridgeia piscesae]|uniref:Uncharacterized protein n=1 Tax=Ridgeia piscesae TaxID=27915 RepID=A0AAD9JRG6_RIDPI|nr:hypothetical protein NP493_1850g00007 [Ridgeia piscesae]